MRTPYSLAILRIGHFTLMIHPQEAHAEEFNDTRLGVGIHLQMQVDDVDAFYQHCMDEGAILSVSGEPTDQEWGWRESARFRQAWEASGRTIADLKALTDPFDPLTYAHRLAGKRLLMIAGKVDEVVPPASTRALWEAAGRPPSAGTTAATTRPSAVDRSGMANSAGRPSRPTPRREPRSPERSLILLQVAPRQGWTNALLATSRLEIRSFGDDPLLDLLTGLRLNSSPACHAHAVAGSQEPSPTPYPRISSRCSLPGKRWRTFCVSYWHHARIDDSPDLRIIPSRMRKRS